MLGVALLSPSTAQVIIVPKPGSMPTTLIPRREPPPPRSHPGSACLSGTFCPGLVGVDPCDETITSKLSRRRCRQKFRNLIGEEKSRLHGPRLTCMFVQTLLAGSQIETKRLIASGGTNLSRPPHLETDSYSICRCIEVKRVACASVHNATAFLCMIDVGGLASVTSLLCLQLSEIDDLTPYMMLILIVLQRRCST